MEDFINEIQKFINFLATDFPKARQEKAHLAVNNFKESLIRLEIRLKELLKIEKEICFFSQKKNKRGLDKVQMAYLDKIEAFHQHVYSTISSFINVLNLISNHSFKRNLPISGVQEFLEFIIKKDIHPIVLELTDTIKKSTEFRAKFVDHPQQHKSHTWMTYAPNDVACIIYYIPGSAGPNHTTNTPLDPYDPNFQCVMPYESFYVSPNNRETYGNLCTFVHFMLLHLSEKKVELLPTNE